MTAVTDLAFTLLGFGAPVRAIETVDLAKSVASIPIFKVEHEQRVVRGVVLEPCSPTFCEPDAQGDIIEAEEIESASHGFMAGLLRGENAIDIDHERVADAVVVESFLAPVEFEEGGQTIRKGSWVLAVKVFDDELWESVKDGSRTAFSIGGRAERVQVT